jgi:protein required for attachment to host cells
MRQGQWNISPTGPIEGVQATFFQQLSLVVSPKFLGMLRKLLDPQLESAVSLEIDKDYTQFAPEQLLEQVKAYRQNH